jgi:hypothetical protein
MGEDHRKLAAELERALGMRASQRDWYTPSTVVGLQSHLSVRGKTKRKEVFNECPS